MRSRLQIFRRKDSLLIGCLLITTCYLLSCNDEGAPKHTRKTVDYIKPIPGTSDSVPVEVAQRGKVLIGYSDCYTCHKEDERSAGPAFRDIAKRYPVKKVYIEMLARKVIMGGGGSWDSAIMDPHPDLSLEDAKTMVTYILSLKK